jgi:hypothetical protein
MPFFWFEEDGDREPDFDPHKGEDLIQLQDSHFEIGRKIRLWFFPCSPVS